MRFEEIRYGQFLSWNDTIQTRWMHLHEPQLWEEEPIGCVMQVTKLEEDDTGALARVTLDCVKSCGGHFFQTISAHSFDEMYKLLGGESPLVDADPFDCMEAALDAAYQTSPHYNVEDDVEEIYEMFNTNQLQRRRG